MEYLIKSSAVLFIFYISYKVFLQRETFFQFNRLYLLLGLFISIFVPFVVIPIYIEYTPNNMQFAPMNNSTMVVNEQISNLSFNWLQLMYSIYVMGVIIFFTKLLLELSSLKLLFSRYRYYKNESLTFIETEDDIPPFSFFNWIVFNPSKYSEEELNYIVNHEKTHAKELHSIDIIIAHIVCAIFWFNPISWLYKRDLEQNLEFIADKKAQRFSNCHKSYQLVLLKSNVSKHKFLITNNFYNSQIKKRIIMLHKSKSKKSNVWKYILVVPMLAFFLMSFNTKKILIEAERTKNLTNESQAVASVKPNSFYNTITNEIENRPKEKPKQAKNNFNTKKDISITVIDKNTTDSELDKIKEDLKKEGLTVKFRGIKRNNKGEITSIKIEAKSKTSSSSYNVNSDKAIDSVKIIYDSENNSISLGNGHTKHGKNVFVYKTHEGGDYNIHKSGNGSNTFVISDDEDEYEHDTKIVIKDNGEKDKVKTIKKSKIIELISEDDATIELIVDDEGNNEEEIIIVNGKKINVVEGKKNKIVKGYKKKVWTSDKDNNEDVIILKSDSDDDTLIVSINDEEKTPLIIIDGKEISKEEFTKVNVDDIESVNVLKDKSAIKKYGNKGKDGVIIIKTKK